MTPSQDRFESLGKAAQAGAFGFVLGGDVFMLAGVRPLLDRGLEEHSGDAVRLAELEALRQDAWLRYNRLALAATALAGGVSVLRLVTVADKSLVRLIGSVVLFGVLMRKHLLDKKLRETLTQVLPTDSSRAAQKRMPPQRTQAAALGIGTIIISAVLILWPDTSRE